MSTTLSSDEMFRGIRRVLWVTMGLNIIPAIAKLSVGYATGSLSITADGFDSVFDAASNVVGLIGIGIAARPADERHPYGHRKAETLASLVICMMLFVTTWELIVSAFGRLRNPGLISGNVTAWSFGALAVSIAIHLLVVWYELREGRRLHSDVLVADALHTRADVFVSLSVAAGLVMVYLGFPLADPIAALIVAACIGKIGIDIIRQATGTVMDQAALPVDRLERTILKVPGVLSVHHVRTHGYETEVMADLHIRVDPSMPAEQSHAIAHEVARRLKEQEPTLKDITVHVEPAQTIPSELTQQEVTLKLRRLADGLGLAVHHVWVYEVSGAFYVAVHLELDGSLSLREAHKLASTLEERARAEIPQLAEVITHIEPHGQLAHQAKSLQPASEVVGAVTAFVDAEMGAGSCHKVQVREGVAGRMLSLHCYLPGEMPLYEAHRKTDRLERDLLAHLGGFQSVVVHAEPRAEENA